MTWTVTLLVVVTGLCVACTASATEPVSAANCEPAEGRVLAGSLHGEEWKVTVEELGGFTMLAVTVNGQDQGAVEVGESTWYHAGATSIVVLTGGLPSRTTQAVAVMVDGTSLAFCPFGDDELLVAAGAVDADQVVDVELRRGGSVIATGMWRSSVNSRTLSPSPLTCRHPELQASARPVWSDRLEPI